MTLTLPWPPALNRYYRNVNSRTLISRDGRAYRSRVAHACYTQEPHDRYPAGPIRVRITAIAPDRRRRDLDGMLKAALDGLTHYGIWTDDSQVDDLRITRGPVDRTNPRLELAIEAIT